MATTALALRPFHPTTDAAPLLDWITTAADLTTWAGPSFTWPLDQTQLAAYAVEPGRHTWTAVPSHGPEAAEPVGHVSLRRHDDAPDRARLGRVLIAPRARGRGLGESLLTETLSRAFTDLRLHSLDLGVFAHNTPAVRLYEKLGFRTVEVLKDVERVDGVWWTALQMRLDSPHRSQ